MKARDLGLVVALLGVLLVAQSPVGCAGGVDPSGGSGGTGGDSAGPTTGTLSSNSASTAGGSTTNTSTVTSGSTTTASSSATTTSSSTGTGGGIVISPGNMIDDMEAGSGSILTQGGRIGAWYTYNDMTATGSQSPIQGSPFIPEIIPGGNGTSTRAAHTYGSGFTTWGAGMGFDLNNSGTVKSTYSATGFTGLAFWAKGSSGIRVKVLTSATVATLEGGTCAASCGDNHGMVVNLTANWVQYTVPFSSLVQEGWGTVAPFDATNLLAVQFQVGANATFDFWIDDIGLY